MEKIAVPIEVCAYCHANIAKPLKCSGCSSQIGHENHASTFYCNRKCQTAHWKIHKTACKAHQTRHLLYRAGSLLQDMFYDYRELLFDFNIVQIEKKDDGLYLKEGKYAEPRTIVNILYPFPQGLAMTAEDRKSVLSYMACGFASAWMKEIAAYFLQDLASEITEIYLNTKNPRQPMKLVGHAGYTTDNQCTHSIMKLTLKNGGGEYALDLTGAQYGYFDPVVPFSEYKMLRIQDIESLNEFGSTKKRYLNFQSMPLVFREPSRMNASVHQAMKGATNKFEYLDGMKESTILKLPREEFEKKRKALLLYVKKAVKHSRDSFLGLQKVIIAFSARGGLAISIDET